MSLVDSPDTYSTLEVVPPRIHGMDDVYGRASEGSFCSMLIPEYTVVMIEARLLPVAFDDHSIAAIK